jgi:hypothetical protein
MAQVSGLLLSRWFASLVAGFGIRAQSPVSPFEPALRQDFRCPAVRAN